MRTEAYRVAQLDEVSQTVNHNQSHTSKELSLSAHDASNKVEQSVGSPVGVNPSRRTENSKTR